MAAMDYLEIRDIAIQLITDAGRHIDIINLDKTPVDSAMPWKGPGVPTVATTTPVMAAFVPPGSGLGVTVEDDELLKRTQQVAFIQPVVGTDLSEADEVLDTGVTWKILWMQVLRPADVTLLYIAGLAR